MIVSNVNLKSSAVMATPSDHFASGRIVQSTVNGLFVEHRAVLVEDPRLVREVGQQLVAAGESGADDHAGPRAVALGRDHVQDRRELLGPDRDRRESAPLAAPADVAVASPSVPTATTSGQGTSREQSSVDRART